ncbi:NADH-quinone oxidoreductase subunit NuoF [Heliobacterium mobile]
MERLDDLNKIISQYKDSPGQLIRILQKAQELYGYLPEDILGYIADKVGLPLSEVAGVVTFYSLFTTKPKGKHTISVCLGTACYVKGAPNVLEAIKKELAVDMDQTTADGLFTLTNTRCVGACGLAPAVLIDGEVHGRVKASDVPELIRQYRQRDQEGGTTTEADTGTNTVTDKTDSLKNHLPPSQAEPIIGPVLSLQRLEQIRHSYAVRYIQRMHPDQVPDWVFQKADHTLAAVPAAKSYRHQILVCAGTGCTSSRSAEIQSTLRRELQAQSLDGEIAVVHTGCFGFCELGPILVVHPERVFYCQVTPNDVPEIVERHIVQGQTVERLLYKHPPEGASRKTIDENEFFHPQIRVALRNCGIIDPENINEYIASGGYFGLAKALTAMKPTEVIETITCSGLRGRGGAGFLTGRKWAYTAAVKETVKYVVCNADEGDPGAFMDRSILEGDPHAVLEAMTIAGYAIGAQQGFVYVRAEYPIAVHRLEVAIDQAHQAGLLGQNILGTGFSFDIEIRLGAGAFVCGEETALLNSVSGKRGEPRTRPPYPAVSGLWGKPTLLNNVETYANIPQIICKGADWYAAMGTSGSKGTKIFSLAGKINNTGLIEVPMGTSLRTIIYGIGGGIPKGKAFKAVQTGGPSGGCLPAEYLDIPIDYDSLMKIGSMMGSGGLIVMDETDCMVDIARFYLEFTQDESCGKCTPCRIGTRRLLEIITRITEGKGTMKDLELLEELGHDIKEASLCGLGQTAPNPVLSTLRHFRHEYEAHIKEKRCPAGVCPALKPKGKYRIDGEKCRRCGLCVKVCPVKAISGEIRKTPFAIDAKLCIACGACAQKCPVHVIAQEGER